jgi:hypothetical protein
MQLKRSQARHAPLIHLGVINWYHATLYASDGQKGRQHNSRRGGMALLIPGNPRYETQADSISVCQCAHSFSRKLELKGLTWT